MRYRLIVLTHGGGDTLTDTLRSFHDRVSPPPAEIYLHGDGEPAITRCYRAAVELRAERVQVGGSQTQVGFCRSTRACWQEAAVKGVDFVYWLEHDFIHAEYVELDHLAAVLEQNPHLAQIALLRQPVNELERDAGGIYASRPGVFHEDGWHGYRWVEHEAYWTTNPSLFRRELAELHSFPDGPECEGKFAFELRASSPDTAFAYWGRIDDGPRVHHFGVRTGEGY